MCELIRQSLMYSEHRDGVRLIAMETVEVLGRRRLHGAISLFQRGRGARSSDE